MSTARAPAPAPSAPHPPSTADNATAPSTPEASRPGSAQGNAAPPPASPDPASLAAPPPRPGPVDWPAQLARLDELRTKTGALPRGALAALAAELGVKEGTVYSQVSRHRRDEALREQGRAAARAQALAEYTEPATPADPSCSDPESQATDPKLIRSGSPSPRAHRAEHTPAHQVELRCPGCATLLTLAVIDPSCSDPAPRREAAAGPAGPAARRPNMIHSGSPSTTPAAEHEHRLDPTEPGLAPDAQTTNPSAPEPCQRTTSP